MTYLNTLPSSAVLAVQEQTWFKHAFFLVHQLKWPDTSFMKFLPFLLNFYSFALNHTLALLIYHFYWLQAMHNIHRVCSSLYTTGSLKACAVFVVVTPNMICFD
jgi:hypothetical protein